MSSIGYGVKIESLTAVKGSCDDDLLKQLRAKFSREFDADDADTRENGDDVSMWDAMHAILYDEIPDDADAASDKYVYAFELLCKHFGKDLDKQCYIHFIDDLGWETNLLEFRNPFEIAEPMGFPFTSFLNLDHVRNEYEKFKDIDLDDDDAELAAGREQFVGWLQRCSNDSLDLVVFTY